jgi:hypothetical protein
VRGDTIVTVGNDQIKLLDVNPWQLSKHDFLFDA